MSTHTHSRRPAGTPSGGQFAPSGHAESPVRVLPRTLSPAEQSTAQNLIGKVRDVGGQDNVPDPAGSADFSADAEVDYDEVRRQVRAMLPHLAETDLELRWKTLQEHAHIATTITAFDDPAEVENLPADALLVDIEDYYVYNAPDRPGETGSTGVDFDQMRDDLLDAWDAKTREEAEFAVRADSELALTTIRSRR